MAAQRAPPCHDRDMTATPDVGPPDVSTDDLLRTAERHATTSVPITSRGETVSKLLARLRGTAFDSASVAAVCEGERLVGLATIERLLSAPPDATVEAVMDEDPPRRSPRTPTRSTSRGRPSSTANRASPWSTTRARSSV